MLHSGLRHRMALNACPLPSAPAMVPAKNTSSMALSYAGSILRTCCVVLHPPPSSSLFESMSAKPLLRPPRAAPPKKYVYPDPIPEFAVTETQKFRAELLKKLCKDRETFGDDLETVVNVCAEIFSEFLHKEYGGPGTLLVEPFTDMLVALKEKKLPGAPLAARASLLWAQNYVDQDWEVWNSKPEK